MFKKKPQIKNLAPLRSSDRRKVVDQIIADYAVEVPTSDPVEGQTPEQAQTSSLTNVRNALLPEGAQSARFTTTVGAEAHNVSGTVYAAQFPDGETRVLWLKLESQLIPTVYTLWKHPRLVPLLHTPDIVLQKMRGGADLMTPGLARGPPFPSKATKGAVVAVAAYENPSVPIVVGNCEIDVSALKEVRGVKGHAVRGLHWEGDEIWNWSAAGRSVGEQAPKHLPGWDEDEDEESSLTNTMATLEVRPSDSTGEQSNDPKEVKQATASVDESDTAPYEEVVRPVKEWNTKDIDLAYKNAFLYALYDAKEKHPGEKSYGIEFPVAQSKFMSDFIMPYLPTFSPEDTAALQIKKTSWKNIRKFIKALDKDILLKSKDRNGNETVVLDVDFNDEQVNGFQPYRLPKKTTSATAQPESAPAATSSHAGDSLGQKVHIVNLLRPNKSLHPIFSASSSDPHALYLPTELRQIITKYIEHEQLIDANDHSKVKINPIIADALYAAATTTTNDYDAQKVMAQGYVARDALFNRAQSHACTSYHLISRASAGSSKVDVASLNRREASAGPSPRIKVIMETRSGNKTATRVSGLEPFGIDASTLADALRKVCAGSTSVAPLVGSSPKKPVMEIMVQGPQRDAVLAQLEKRGVNKAWVDVTDKTKKKGR